MEVTVKLFNGVELTKLFVTVIVFRTVVLEWSSDENFILVFDDCVEKLNVEDTVAKNCVAMFLVSVSFK